MCVERWGEEAVILAQREEIEGSKQPEEISRDVRQVTGTDEKDL